ncbi:flagella synthesis protein FlgN [Pseudomonas sp. Q1-7]|uniref:flagella synthesis protein FlgN n=1 Tax=Pseudomonas sp. Q1-7 TaxID=3020843 RepID=UPI002301AD73|nr:flagellar protein FlgN [Pseudomonas sp. Q1-7]
MTRRDKLLNLVERDIQQDRDDYLALRGLMQRLYGHLLERDSPRIEQANRDILALVDALGERAARRAKVLAAFGHAPGMAGMDSLFAHYPGVRGERLGQAWQQLGQLAAQCKQLNERNGKLLAMHNDILTQLLGANEGAQLYTQQAY